MASLTYETGTRTGWRLRAYSAQDSRVRHSVWLGDVRERDARTICCHVEAVYDARKHGTPVPGETVRWINQIDARLRCKLAPMLGAVRTVQEAQREFLRDQAAQHKSSTLRSYLQTLTIFSDAFAHRPMRSLIAADVDSWLDRLNMAPNTVAKHAKQLKTFFAWCQSKDYMDPLRIRTSSAIGVGDKDFIPADDLQTWINHFRRQPEIQCGLAIARWSGVRVPSELQTLTIASVDWDASRLHIVDSKRSRRAARAPPVVRETPLFPELVPYLRKIWPADGSPTDPLLPSIAADGGAAFVRECKEARDQCGLEWPRLFTSVRATRESELIHRFDVHTACEWIGNSPAVAAKFYQQITAETWTVATTVASLS